MGRLGLLVVMVALSACADRADERHTASFTLVQNVAAPQGFAERFPEARLADADRHWKRG